MNLSGQSGQGLIDCDTVPLTYCLVLSDELDIACGTGRLRAAGGPGGQRGMSSVIEKLGTKEFPRLRIGIGRPPGRMDASDYVLQNFSRSEMQTLSEILDHAEKAVFTFITYGLNKAMNDFNGGISE
jgi:PTH1 family peptidyl-tRNA hydrolase